MPPRGGAAWDGRGPALRHRRVICVFWPNAPPRPGTRFLSQWLSGGGRGLFPFGAKTPFLNALRASVS